MRDAPLRGQRAQTGWRLTPGHAGCTRGKSKACSAPRTYPAFIILKTRVASELTEADEALAQNCQLLFPSPQTFALLWRSSEPANGGCPDLSKGWCETKYLEKAGIEMLGQDGRGDQPGRRAPEELHPRRWGRSDGFSDALLRPA